MVACGMALHPRVLQLLAAVFLCAAWLAPSLASAHTGHAHHAPAPATIEAPVTPAAAAEQTATTTVAHIEIARAVSTAADRGDGGCASHCCGGTAGVTCCTAALAPEVSPAPPFTGSQTFRFARAGALLGLPPEALPKPPKSLA